MEVITFQRALEIVESLSEDQRESLIEIVKHRLIEERRDRLARSIKEAREEYRQGQVRRGSMDDLVRDLEK
jgi:ribosome recycling factor